MPAGCEPVAGLGPITAAVPESDRRIFLAVAAERNGRGAIYRFNAADPLAQDNWRDRTGGSPAEFAPANVDYFEADGMRRLFVANAAGRSIDVFDVDEKGDLSLVVSFTERRLANPIAVAATGPDSFYVVNDGRQAMHLIAKTGRSLPANRAAGDFTMSGAYGGSKRQDLRSLPALRFRKTAIRSLSARRRQTAFALLTGICTIVASP